MADKLRVKEAEIVEVYKVKKKVMVQSSGDKLSASLTDEFHAAVWNLAIGYVAAEKKTK